MILSEFLRRFHLPWQVDAIHDYPFAESTRPAAVLIALNPSASGLQVLFTERAHHLTHHAGQVSFPGGKYEPDDTSLIHTALREAHEEIGLAPDNVEVIGSLPDYKTISGFSVRPIVGVLTHEHHLHQDFVLDPNEVQTIFQVPLEYLMQDKHYFTHFVTRYSHQFPVHFLPYADNMIWGATAGMLSVLGKHINTD